MLYSNAQRSHLTTPLSPPSEEDDYLAARSCATISPEVIEANNPSPKLEVRLTGPAAEGGRLRVDVLLDVAHAVQTAVTRLAYGLRGEATVRRGRAPREVADLTRLEIVGLREGSTVLVFELAGHERPLDEFDLGLEALGAFEAGLPNVAAGETPPAPWDAGVIDAVEHLAPVFDKGIDQIVVGDPAVDQRAVLTKPILEVRRLAASPTTRELTIVEGRLLMADFSATRDEARIHRPHDPPVRCRFGPDLESTVLRLLRRYVRATGSAEFDENGRIRVLELESLEDAEPAPGRSFWELPSLDELAEERGVEPVERLEDLVSGFWPEDESVDEFLAAIESRD